MSLRMPLIPKVPPPQAPLPRATQPSAPPSPSDSDALDPYHESFDINRIGAGGRFIAGSQRSKSEGLWGALGKIKHHAQEKNLSEKNLKIFHDLIGERLRDRPETAPHLDSGDKESIVSKAHEMYYTKGELSDVDMRDLKHIVDVLSEKNTVTRSSDLLAQRVVAVGKGLTHVQERYGVAAQGLYARQPPPGSHITTENGSVSAQLPHTLPIAQATRLAYGYASYTEQKQKEGAQNTINIPSGEIVTVHGEATLHAEGSQIRVQDAFTAPVQERLNARAGRGNGLEGAARVYPWELQDKADPQSESKGVVSYVDPREQRQSSSQPSEHNKDGGDAASVRDVRLKDVFHSAASGIKDAQQRTLLLHEDVEQEYTGMETDKVRSVKHDSDEDSTEERGANDEQTEKAAHTRKKKAPLRAASWDAEDQQFMSKAITHKTKLSWKIGGEAGFGIKGAGDIMVKTIVRSGFCALGYAEYPSLIRGGHNTYQITFAHHPVRSNSECVDVLIALNIETIDVHEAELNPDGMMVYDSTTVGDRKPSDAAREKNLTVIPVPFTQIAKEAGSSELMRNTVALGASVALLGADWDIFIDTLKENFGRKGGEIVTMNEKAARHGYDSMRTEMQKRSITPYQFGKRTGQPSRVVMTGNDAVGVGALAGGCQVYAAYPMTPTSSLLQTFAALDREWGLVVKHAEDEISVINMALGASFAGARVMVGTSGGGFSLMVESVGLAGITETPIVIYEGQRPGPATGLPTWTEQGDVRFVMHAAQGEFPRVVVAPGDLEESYAYTKHAFYLAEKYQIPVIVLSDKFLGESTLSAELFEDTAVDNERQGLITDSEIQTYSSYLRYRMTSSGVSPRSLPGQPGGVHLANSDEHDEYGLSDETSAMRAAMVDKRNRKALVLKAELPDPIRYGPAGADVTFITWGSQKGPVLDAMDQLAEEGIIAELLHLTYILPFPQEVVAETLSQARTSIIVENNSESQLAGVIKQYTGRSIDHKLLKYDGRPFWPEEIVRRTKELLKK